MPLPSNLQTITLTGTYLDSTGAALSGTISFTPPPELVDVATAIMYAAPVTATLDSSGHFSVTLICTDNSTLAPAGWGYTVQEAIKGNRSYTIFVPHTYGSTVDISSLVPLPDLTGAPVPTTVAAIAPGYAALAYNQTWTGAQTFDGAVAFATTPTLPGGTLDPLDWINVKTQGAMGDGATDDTTAIQAALDACPRGGIVYFPCGVYRTSAPLIQQPYTTCKFTHGSGQFQLGGASPYSSIKPLSTFAGPAVWRILDENLGGYAAPTILAQPNTGTYQVISAEYTIEGMSIDGSALVASNVNGIDILGQVQDVYLRDVDVQQCTGDGINSTYNFAVTNGPQAPFAVHFERIAVQQCTGTGIVLSNATDSTFMDCYVLGCGSFGWWIAWPGNSLFVACRAEWSTYDGFHVTAQGGQTQFVGCSTDRNGSNGMYITGTGTPPGVVSISGLMLNRDGRNSGSGGGGYAGLNVAGTNSAVVVDGITVWPGYDDGGGGTLSPEYGVTAAGQGFLAINTGMINGATAAWFDGGGNTTILRGVNVVEGTGQTIGTSVPGMELTRTGATINGTLNVTGAVGLTTALPVASGGTGSGTASTAFNNLSPLTTLGDILAAGASGVDQRVAGNTTATKQFLIQTGTGSASALPTWGVIAAADVPTLNQNTTGNAATATSATSFTGALAGDVTGTQSATSVGKLQGITITTTEATLVSDLNNATTRSATATLLPGEETVYTGSTGSQTLTLPVSAPTSSINTVTNAASVSVTLAPGAGSTLSNFDTVGNVVVPAGYAFSLVYIGTVWYVTQAGPSDFATSNALSIANGGTGHTTAQAAINALAGGVTSGDYLRGNGTNVVLSTIQAADLPTATTLAFGAVKLDGTAGDIQPLGVQGAGASGLAADAKHVHAFSSAVLTSPVTVTGVTAATLLFGGPTLAAGTARAGLIYTFELWGGVTTTVDTQTVEFALYWGGVTGTMLANVGPNAPNGSATVSGASWKMRFSVTFLSATQASASGEDGLNYFYTTENQSGVITISNASSEQLVIGVINSASAVSVTANGAYWHQKG